jgi:3-hydroxyacyl-[acyl-carrier-protein] dehydratase
MPNEPFLALSSINPEQILQGVEQIRETVPQRHEFEMLQGILHFDHDAATAVAIKTIGEDEFWARGHIPGKPIFPGVLMIESAAQLCAYTFARVNQDKRFFAFGGVDAVRFRGTVTPGDQVILMARAKRMRRNLGMYDSQAYVDGKLVYEGVITGMILPEDKDK